VHVANAVGFAVAAGLFALIWAAGRRGHPFCAVSTVAVVLALGGAKVLGPPWWQHAAAIPLLDAFVKANPKNSLTPIALSAKGTAQIARSLTSPAMPPRATQRRSPIQIASTMPRMMLSA
jgi:hypothetical protein